MIGSLLKYAVSQQACRPSLDQQAVEASDKPWRRLQSPRARDPLLTLLLWDLHVAPYESIFAVSRCILVGAHTCFNNHAVSICPLDKNMQRYSTCNMLRLMHGNGLLSVSKLPDGCTLSSKNCHLHMPEHFANHGVHKHLARMAARPCFSRLGVCTVITACIHEQATTCKLRAAACSL